MVLAIALACLMLASAFAPQVAVEAKAAEQPPFAIEDVSTLLLRLVAWAPAEPVADPAAVHSVCAEAAQTPAFRDLL